MVLFLDAKWLPNENSQGDLVNLAEYNTTLQDKAKTQKATHALVFMMCNCKHRLIQPISYYFTCKTVPAASLVVMIPDITKRLLNYGLNIRAFVCDRGSTNRSALKNLGVSAKSTDGSRYPTFHGKTRKNLI